MLRREFLGTLTAGAGALAIGACRVEAPKESPAVSPPTRPTPALFVAHGAPMILDDQGWMGEFAAWGKALGKPKAILMLSAHWTAAPFTIGATETVPLIYDFYGFPKRYYDVQYPAPGAPALAARVRELVEPAMPVAHDPTRGLDHGAYIPLMGMYPEADVPVLSVSLPTMKASALLELGRRLAPLRHEDVLIFGSGFLTHNMQELARGPNAKPPAWATEFDAWVGDVLARRDVDALAAYRERAPGVSRALPTHEHFVPVAVTLGAAAESTGDAAHASFPIEGFAFGSFTKRSVQYG